MLGSDRPTWTVPIGMESERLVCAVQEINTRRTGVAASTLSTSTGGTLVWHLFFVKKQFVHALTCGWNDFVWF